MKKWYVNDEEFDNVLDAVEEVVENGDFEDEFDDFLRDEYGDSVEICGVYFDAIEALKDLDEMEYEQKFDAWKEGLSEDLETRFNSMCIGDLRSFYGYDIEVRDADAELFVDAGKKISMIREFVSSVPSIYGDNTRTLEAIESLAEIFDTMAERIKGEEE